MVSNISYIDDTRVAVWGWSYGGYLAAQILAEDDRRLISCAVSVAPVVKWQLYGKHEYFCGYSVIEEFR